MNREEKKMLKQEKAIADSLRAFLYRFDCAWYSIENPVTELEKYFDVSSDGN
jgi:hypothetical protein